MPKRILFICGSMNQTTQMHQIAAHLSDYEQAFTPFYCDGLDEVFRRRGWMEFTIIGNKLASRCRSYLEKHTLTIDYQGKNGPYDLVLTCSDVYMQRNIRTTPIVLVQEGITDPETFAFYLVTRLRFLPLWLAGTAATGLSNAYRTFCVASDGYRDLFIRKGARPEKITVTGIPNFDNCDRYRQNDFPHRGFVLVCSSDVRLAIVTRFLRRVLAVTSATCLARTSPPRSTRACTACFLGSGLPLWTFFFLPPTNVSSDSITLPSPPSGPDFGSGDMASRRRMVMNHAVW